jgi:hypothetical protein
LRVLDDVVVNDCLDAMEDGTLHVCAVTEVYNYFLWECREMSTVQWKRLCGLLQRAAIPSSVMWSIHSYLLFGTHPYILERPEVVEIDYVWEDLDAVRRFLAKWHQCAATEVFKRQLEQRQSLRQSWMQGLRRAWLVAALVFAALV